MDPVDQFVTDTAVFGGDVPGVDERIRCVPVVPDGGCQQPQGASHPLEVRIVGQPLPGDPENARVERIAVVEVLLRPVGVCRPVPLPQFRVRLWDCMPTGAERLVWSGLRVFRPDLRLQPAVLRADAALRAGLRLTGFRRRRGPR